MILKNTPTTRNLIFLKAFLRSYFQVSPNGGVQVERSGSGCGQFFAGAVVAAVVPSDLVALLADSGLAVLRAGHEDQIHHPEHGPAVAEGRGARSQGPDGHEVGR